MLEDVRERIREGVWGRSGASVTSLTEVVSEGPYIDDGEVEGSAKRESLWAPFLGGER
jgi:hypothetical protein